MSALTNSVDVVTGGRIGLGRALGLEAARRGATVVIASQSDASSTVTEIQETGARAEWIRTDVSDYASVEALAEHVRTTYGGTNVLVNNAAAGGDPGRLDTTDPAAARRLFEVNITGVFNGIRAFLRQRPQGPDSRRSPGPHPERRLGTLPGRTAACGAPERLHGQQVRHYATLAFTDTARRDFAGAGAVVNVSLLAPGWVLTERVAELTDASPQAVGAILPYAQDSAEVAAQGIDGLLRGE